MSNAVGPNGRRSEVNRPLISILFFLSPLVTSAVPLVTWLFLPLIGIALIVSALRRGCEWRQLLPPNPALAAFLLLALYVFLNATWAADRGAAFGKAAVLLGLILLTFTALVRARIGVEQAQAGGLSGANFPALASVLEQFALAARR